ncbi:MAG: glycerol-3-phosphate 1-O-acyltransferase PlsY [Pseudomonadota bacterium]|nr:glycerol-3-phosphate 1-O-acyltransferase PlsY [Pseudomonadota bacterium]
MTALLVICLAIIVGSIPSGVILSRLFTGKDVRKAGSGNFGAANVVRTAGLRIGVLVAIADILKGVLPVALGLAAGLSHPALALVALAAVAGHDFSIFIRLRGGKGVATTLGVALMLVPIVAVIAMLVWLATMGISRYSALASLIALAVLPVLALLTAQPGAYIWLFVALFVLAAGKHWENIVRLSRGKESRFSKPRTVRDA